MDSSQIAQLVRDVRKGDQQAFNKLVMHFQTAIYNLAFNYLKDTEEAKDITQDIFVTVHRSLNSLKDEAKFKSWLFQIAVNHCRNRYKSLKRKAFYNSYSFDDPDSFLQISTGDSPEKDIEKRNTSNIVRNAIAGMPELEKEIILLRDIQELSYEEISTALDLPLGTVKSRLNRARLALKDKLKHLL